MFTDDYFDPSSPCGNLDSVRLSDASPTSPRNDPWADVEHRQNLAGYIQDSVTDNESVSKYDPPLISQFTSAEEFFAFNHHEALYQGYQYQEAKKQNLILEDVYKQEQPEDNEEKEYAELQPVEERPDNQLNNKLGDIFQMAMRNSPSPPPVDLCPIQRGCESPSYIAIMDEIHTAASSYSAPKPAPPPPAPVVSAPAQASRRYILLPVQVELQTPAPGPIPVRGRGRPRATGPAPTPEAEYMRQYRLRQKQKKAAAAAKH